MKAIWEHRLVGVEDDGFGDVIPASVQSIRFVVQSGEDGPSCCLAIARGSATFARRSFVFNALPPGAATLRAHAYPVLHAPADGIAATCSTDPPGQGEPCDADLQTLPSFESLPVAVTILPVERTDAGLLRFLALPFLIRRDPAPGGSVVGPRPRIEVAVVDAGHDIAPDLSVTLFSTGLPAEIDVHADQASACDDRGPGPACSQGRQLDVRGVFFSGRPPAGQPLPSGAARVNVEAGDTSSPSRRLFESYPIEITSPPTTTLVTSTTLESVTTTTSDMETTTTTLVASAVHCAIRFGIAETDNLGMLQFRVDYPSAPGNVVGVGSSTACRPLVSVDSAVLQSSDTKRLLGSLTSANGFATPASVVECDFDGSQVPLAPQFVFSTVVAKHTDLSSAAVTLFVSSITCVPGVGSP